MREQLIKALLAHAQGDIAKHKANIEVYLANPVGIGAVSYTHLTLPTSG